MWSPSAEIGQVSSPFIRETHHDGFFHWREAGRADRQFGAVAREVPHSCEARSGNTKAWPACPRHLRNHSV